MVDQTGPIVIVSASGDAAVRGMRRGDMLVGVQHTPLPAGATLSHVQELMETFPRPLALNLYRPSPWETRDSDFFAAALTQVQGGDHDGNLLAAGEAGTGPVRCSSNFGSGSGIQIRCGTSW